MELSERVKLIADEVEKLGYEPEPLKETDGIVFHTPTGHFAVLIYADNENYASVVFPDFWPIHNDGELEAVLMSASKTNASCRGVKVYVRNDGEQTVALVPLIGPPQHTSRMLAWSVKMLDEAVNFFGQKMGEIAAFLLANEGPVDPKQIH